MASTENGIYEYALTPESEEKAKKELHEDPKNRLGAVDTLVTWVKQQKHMTSSQDTRFLLAFLRTAKHSQLRARQILENFLKLKTDNPQWFYKFDFHDPELISIFKKGYVFPLPGTDEYGRRQIIIRLGAVTSDYVKENKHGLFRVSCSILWYLLLDENVQVNGVVYFVDCTGITMSHFTAWGIHDLKESMKFQDAVPARFKGIHYYNVGAVFEAFFEVIKPLMKPKIRDRVKIHGTNLEDVYEYIPMSNLPDEYLPDEYKGPRVGTIDQLLNNLLNELQKPEIKKQLLNVSNDEWKINKKLKEDIPNESFRKLNVD